MDLNRYQILWQHSIATLVQSFQGDSLLLTTESLGVPGTLLIDLTMKTPSCCKWVNPGLVIGNHSINSLLFHYNKAMYKIFKI